MGWRRASPETLALAEDTTSKLSRLLSRVVATDDGGARPGLPAVAVAFVR